MTDHYPNAETYRPWLGVAVNEALIQLAIKKNSVALAPLSTSDYLEKMVRHWWKIEFPGEKFPVELKRYDKDFDV